MGSGVLSKAVALTSTDFFCTGDCDEKGLQIPVAMVS